MNMSFDLRKALLSALLMLSLLLPLGGVRAEEAAPGGQEAADAAEEEDYSAFLLIYVSGYPYAIEPLDTDRDVTITQPSGETNVIHITHNGFHMASSTCDNQLCITEGEVTVDNFETRILGPYVLCLPNRVELELIKISNADLAQGQQP